MNNKTYKAIYFDWDGTAVLSRTADAKKVIEAMKHALSKNIKLIVISGTTYENICGGEIASLFPHELLQNLYFGLGRGCYNFGYDEIGNIKILKNNIPTKKDELLLHKICFDIHNILLSRYNLRTDIIFSRANYCKIDLTVDNPRTESLFMQDGEIQQLNEILKSHNLKGGIKSLIELAYSAGELYGVAVKITTDAKYLEVGFTTKSDNVDFYYKYFENMNISSNDSCYWGDEFGEIGYGIWGSDSQMITSKTNTSDFYSVSNLPNKLPESVVDLKGSCDRFIEFLYTQ